MKLLLVGGAAQGKRARAAEYKIEPPDAAALAPDEALAALAEGALANLHVLARALLAAGRDPAEAVLAALEGRQDWLLTCDEVGCGVVPVERAERDWREAVGRLCCELAHRADRVERVSCGIPQRIKG